jgi:hypothetical protein
VRTTAFLITVALLLISVVTNIWLASLLSRTPKDDQIEPNSELISHQKTLIEVAKQVAALFLVLVGIAVVLIIGASIGAFLLYAYLKYS